MANVAAEVVKSLGRTPGELVGIDSIVRTSRTIRNSDKRQISLFDKTRVILPNYIAQLVFPSANKNQLNTYHPHPGERSVPKHNAGTLMGATLDAVTYMVAMDWSLVHNNNNLNFPQFLAIALLGHILELKGTDLVGAMTRHYRENKPDLGEKMRRWSNNHRLPWKE